MQYAHIAANETQVLAFKPTVLTRVTVNKRGGGGNTLSVYDALLADPARLVGVIDTTDTGSGLSLEYGISLEVGLVVVLGGGTPADITVVYL